jgi:hypothetical protein
MGQANGRIALARCFPVDVDEVELRFSCDLHGFSHGISMVLFFLRKSPWSFGIGVVAHSIISAHKIHARSNTSSSM